MDIVSEIYKLIHQSDHLIKFEEDMEFLMYDVFSDGWRCFHGVFRK